MQLRCKHKTGMQTITSLNPQSTLSDLVTALALASGIPETSMIIKCGFPPRPLCVTSQTALNSLTESSVRSGDTLIVDEDKSGGGETIQTVIDKAAPSSGPRGITRKEVPADNSCLFTSVQFCRTGVLDTSAAESMRPLVAGLVMSDQETYTEAFLGMSNQSYCDWITNTEHWGGAIEVSLLSCAFQLEICVVDTQTVRILRFGEDQHYPQRILLIYDGIHYDPLVYNSPDGKMTTMFSATEQQFLDEALEFAREANKRRQYTDLHKFKIRCITCDMLLTGQSDAKDHAKLTGHINFGAV